MRLKMIFDVEVKQGDDTIAKGRTNGPVTNNGIEEIEVFDLSAPPRAGFLTLVLTDTDGNRQEFEGYQASNSHNDRAVFQRC